MFDTLYVSNYLNIYPSHRNTSILFNGFNGCLDEVSSDLGNILFSHVNNNHPLPQEIVNQCSRHTIAFLLKRGHLTSLNRNDEIERFCKHVSTLNCIKKEGRKQEGVLMLVPSYNCNLACTYCFQSTLRDTSKSTDRIMTVEQVDRLFNSLMKQLFPDVTAMSRIRIVLYGGEPFLAIHDKVLQRIIDHTVRRQMNVSAITNGTQIYHVQNLFGNEMGLINKVQISLDGSKERHDITRIGRNSQPTFETIITNIHKLISRRVRIQLRLNIDRSSVLTLPSLLKRLDQEGLLGNCLVHPYACVVHNHFNELDSKMLLSSVALADYMEKHCVKAETPVGKCEKDLRHVFEVKKGISLKRTAFCMKSIPNSYVYDAYDNIYSCYEEAGHVEKRSGYIGTNGTLILNELYREGLSRYVGTIDECKKCSVALTCGGGCPFVAAQKTGNIYSPDCDSHKECVGKAMQNLFRQKMEHRNVRHDEDTSETLFPFA